jgi:hypothetical protein
MPTNKFKPGQLAAKLQQVKKALPKLMALEAQRHYAGSFTRQGFDGQPWAQVKRRIPGTPEYKYPKNTGLNRRTLPILTGTGKLSRAVGNVAKSLKVSSTKGGFKATLSIGKDAVKYAGYINNGTPRMPQRKFMGRGHELQMILKKLVATEVGKACR